MPCTCDYPEPSRRQREVKRTAKLLIFIRDQFPDSPDFLIPRGCRAVANDDYPDVTLADKYTRALCRMCKRLPDSFIYNGRDKQCRALADWWDEHQAMDAARKKREAEEAAKNKRIAKAKAKLTPQELKDLGL